MVSEVFAMTMRHFLALGVPDTKHKNAPKTILARFWAILAQ